jgi:hypothetical protein
MIQGRPHLTAPLEPRASEDDAQRLLLAAKALNALFDLLEVIRGEDTGEARELEQFSRLGMGGQTFTLAAARLAVVLSQVGSAWRATIEDDDTAGGMAVLDTGDGIPGQALAESEYPISMASS